MKKNFKSAVNVLQNSFGLGGFGRPGRPHAAEKAKCRPRVEFRCSRLQLSGAAGDPLRLSGWGGASRVQVAPRARSALARSRGRPVHPAASGWRGARRRVPVLEAVTLVGGIGPPETCAWTPTLRPSPHSRLSAGRLGGIRAGRATGHICGGVRGRLHGGRLTARRGGPDTGPRGARAGGGARAATLSADDSGAHGPREKGALAAGRERGQGERQVLIPGDVSPEGEQAVQAQTAVPRLGKLSGAALARQADPAAPRGAAASPRVPPTLPLGLCLGHGRLGA